MGSEDTRSEVPPPPATPVTAGQPALATPAAVVQPPPAPPATVVQPAPAPRKGSSSNKTMIIIIVVIVVACALILLAILGVAVLYLSVSQFTGVESMSAPTGTISASAAAGGTETLAVGRFSPDTAPTEIRLLITTPTGFPSITCDFKNDRDGDLKCTPSGIEMTYIDIADNRLLNVGDSILMTGSSGSALDTGTWQVSILHIDTGELITSVTFTK